MKKTKFKMITFTCLAGAFLSGQFFVEGNENGSTESGANTLNNPSLTNKEVKEISHNHITTTNEMFKTHYTGDWHDYTLYRVGTASSEVSVKFVGNQIDVFARKSSYSGKVDVEIDGVKVETVDTSLPEGEKPIKALVFSAKNLTNGEHTLVLKPADNKYYYHAGVAVTHDPIYYERLDGVSDTLTLSEKAEHQLTVQALPEYATDSLTYTSSDSNIVSVSSTGLIKAHQQGTAEITIVSHNQSKKIAVTVLEDESIVSAVYGTTGQHTKKETYADLLAQDQTQHKKVVAWLGEEINDKIVLLAKEQDLINVRVQSTNFTNGESVVSSDLLKAYFIRETQGHIGRGGIKGVLPGANVPREMIPDILDKATSKTIQSNSMQPVWLKLAVPKDAVPGVYTGKIVVTADNLEKPLEIPYTFEVKDLKTDGVNRFSMELWQYPFTTARYYGITQDELFSEKHLNLLRQELSEYVKIGGTAITVTISEDPWNSQTYDSYPSMVKWTKKADGTFAFDFTHFDKYVTMAMELGIDKQIKSFSLTPWDNQVAYFDEATQRVEKVKLPTGSQEWKNVWGQFLESYIQHLDEKGWFDITYLAMDERPLADMEHVVELVHQYKNKDNQTLKLSAAMNYSAEKAELLNDIHDISIDLDQIKDPDSIREVAAQRRAKGFTTTLYTCVGDYPSSFARSAPVESAWTLWYAESLGMDGYLRWAYDAWVEDPLTNIDHWWWESGDPFLVYPADRDSEDKTPRTSPRFEQFKIAKAQIEKLRYLKTISSEAAKDVDDLLLSVSREYGVRNAYGAKQSTGLQQDLAVEAEVDRLNKAVNALANKHIHGIVEETETTKEVSQPIFDQVPTSQLTLAAGSTEPQPGNEIENALDGDPTTIWHSEWAGKPLSDLWLSVDTGEVRNINGLGYMARGDGGYNGKVQEYEIYVSQDNANWELVKSGQFTEGEAWQDVTFDPIKARYIKLQAVRTVGDGGRENRFMAVSEIRVSQLNTVEEKTVLDFESTTRERSDIPFGIRLLAQKGEKGTRTIVKQVIQNGGETTYHVLSDEVIQPVNEIIEIGTNKQHTTLPIDNNGLEDPDKRLEIKNDSIPFDTEVIENKDLPKGERRVKQAGKNGEKRQYIEVSSDGKKETLKEEVLVEPIKEILEIGTKEESKPSSNIRFETINTLLPFKTITVETSQLPQGEKRIKQKGQSGSKRQVFRIELVNGKEVKTLVSSNTIAAIDEIIEVGVKHVAGNGSTTIAPNENKLSDSVNKQQTKDAKAQDTTKQSAKALPNTGDKLSHPIFTAASLAILASVGIVVGKKRENEE